MDKFLKEHRFICGITRSGKTTHAVELFKVLHGCRIFVNTQYERMVEAAVDKKENIVTKVKALCKLLEKYEGKIVFNPDPEVDKSVEQITDIWKVLKEVGKIMTEERARVWCHLFIDEVHLFGKKLDVIWRMSARYGIKVVAISQRPADVSHTILTQSPIHIIYNLSPYETP
jgi:AAA+ ATPase superfamily predicted ATPase